MKNLKLAVWIFLLWLFQTVFSRFVRIDGISPDILYVFVLCMAINEKKPSYYITIGIICGFIADAFTGGIPGFYLLAYTCTVLLTVMMGEIIYKELFLIIAPVTAVFTFILNSIYFLINHTYLQEISYAAALKSIILPVIIYNTVVAIIINPLLKKTVYTEKKLRRRR